MQQQASRTDDNDPAAAATQKMRQTPSHERGRRLRTTLTMMTAFVSIAAASEMAPTALAQHTQARRESPPWQQQQQQLKRPGPQEPGPGGDRTNLRMPRLVDDGKDKVDRGTRVLQFFYRPSRSSSNMYQGKQGEPGTWTPRNATIPDANTPGPGSAVMKADFPVGGAVEAASGPIEPPCAGVSVVSTTPIALAFARRCTEPFILLPERKGTSVSVDLYNLFIDPIEKQKDDSIFAVKYIDNVTRKAKCKIWSDIARGAKIGTVDVWCDADRRDATFDYVVGLSYVGVDSKTIDYDVDLCDKIMDAADEKPDEKKRFEVTVDCRSDCPLPPPQEQTTSGAPCNPVPVAAPDDASFPPGDGMVRVLEATDMNVAVELINTVYNEDVNVWAIETRSQKGRSDKFKTDVEVYTDKKLHSLVGTYTLQCDVFGYAQFRVAVFTKQAYDSKRSDKEYDDMADAALMSYTVSVDCKSECYKPPSVDGGGASLAIRLAEKDSKAGSCDCAPPKKCIRQSNFDTGTYRITTPGYYVLCEDISFDPNPPADPTNKDDVLDGCCLPRASQLGTDYDPDAYSLGFFAGITVECDDVTIDLNGHMFDQSPRHALVQRFFSTIELADRSFIPGQGPGMFGMSFKAANRVVIKNGIIGRTSHHGIHGNGNKDITIKDVIFDGFEVAAVALNGCDGALLNGLTATNAKTVPVLGMYNAALIIRHFCKEAIEADVTLTVLGVERTAADICGELDDQIFNVHEDVVLGRGFIDKVKHPAEYALFHNPSGTIDGNAYCFVSNQIGVAVQGFPFAPVGGDAGKLPANNVTLIDCVCHDLWTAVDETIALRFGGGGSDTAVADTGHAVLQLRNVHPDSRKPITMTTLDDDSIAKYVGNAVSNAQILVGKCRIMGFCPKATRNKIPEHVVRMVEEGRTLRETIVDLVDGEELGPANTNGYICNVDSVGHVNKGLVPFKMDATDGLQMTRCRVVGAKNGGRSGSNVCGDSYGLATTLSTYPGYQGANIRGISVAGTERAMVKECKVKDMESAGGMVVGLDIHTDSSDVCVEEFVDENLVALGILTEEVDAAAYGLCQLDAIGIQVGPNTRRVSLVSHSSSNLVSNAGQARKFENKQHEEIGQKCPFGFSDAGKPSQRFSWQRFGGK